MAETVRDNGGFNYNGAFDNLITQLKVEGRYRVFADVERDPQSFPIVTRHLNGKRQPIAVWCSNDYLAMGQSAVVIDAMHTALDRYGAGAGGTRNISGNHHEIVLLEETIAELYQKEAALVFSSGYVANETALSTIPALLPQCVILSDADNHASMIHGIKGAKCEKIIFRHNDPAHLDALLSILDPDRPKLVAFESVYSMDGQFAPLAELVAVAKKHRALIYVDETHAAGLYGRCGAGRIEEAGLLQEVDIIQGGLGKGYGVVGGFIAASKRIVDVVRSYGAGFIFTTTIPPVVAAGARASINYLRQSAVERAQLHQQVKKTRAALHAEGLPLMPSISHITPLMVGHSGQCKAVSDRLLELHNIYIQPINYPTVPRGTERLRITPTPRHTDEMIAHLAEALREVWCHLSLRKAA